MRAIASTPSCGRDPCAARPRNHDPVPGEALVRDRDVDLGAGRLGDDGGVGRDRLRHRLGTGRRELLVADRGHHHVTGQPALGRGRRGHHDRGQAGLHVVGAAPVETVALDAGPERVAHAVNPDHVHVRVQEQRAAAAATTGPPHGIGPAGLGVGYVHLEPAGLHPAAHEPRDLGLPRPTRHQPRVDGVDRDQLRQQRTCVFHARHTTDPPMKPRDGAP